MRLVELRVLRTPGIRTPFTLAARPGVNLITGPNGAGKSSVYRAILNLLWPAANAESPFEAAAEFAHEGRNLRVARVDRGPVTWSGERPDLGPDHLAARYRLGVLELLQSTADDDPLVRELRRHLAGGFDLEQVKRDLFVAGKGVSEKGRLHRAVERVADIEKDHRALAGQRTQLAELRRKRDLAARAADRQRVLMNIRSLAEQHTRLSRAEADLAAVPPGVARAREDDPKRLADLQRQEKGYRTQAAEHAALLADLENRIKVLTSRAPVDDESAFGLLRKRHAGLTELRRDVRQARRDVDKVLASAHALDTTPRPDERRAVLLTLVAGSLLLVVGAAGFLAPDLGVPQVAAVSLAVLGAGLAGTGLRGLWALRSGADRKTQRLNLDIEIARTKEVHHRLESEWSVALGEFNAELATAGLQAAADLEQADQTLEDLAARREEYRQADTTYRQTEVLLARDRGDLDRVRAEIGALFSRLLLADSPSAATVEQLVRLKPAQESARAAGDAARQEIQRLTAEIAREAHRLQPDEDTTLAAGELERRIKIEQELADVRDPLQAEIATIEAGIKRASGSHDLEQALLEVSNARTALTDVRDATRHAALGRLLVDRVAAEHEAHARPAVLAAAMKYFGDFTHHRYRLVMAATNDGPDGFQAETDGAARPLNLDELSDGTRAQLLLAVKLAFITAGETDARPPLFLDDSLASADPERFATVARSLGRIAQAEQRQIFYLTPNPADIAAWKRALEAVGLPPAHVLDLAEIRGTAGAVDPDLMDPATLSPVPAAPDPTGMTAGAYAAALQAPAPDPWDSRGDIHLVLLLDDDLDLVRRMVDGGAPTLARYSRGRAVLLAARILKPGEAERIDRRGKIWRAFLDAWRIGRSAPVPRSFFRDSAAVSKAFAPRLDELLAACGGQARGLMAALRRGDVKGFREDKKNLLQQELEQAGYLDERDQLDRGDLILRTMAGLDIPSAGERAADGEVRRSVVLFESLLASPGPEN